MGLDISHNTWHGSYSAFNRWRETIAAVAGFPPLNLMEGYYESGSYRSPFADFKKIYPTGKELGAASCNEVLSQLPIKWACLKESGIKYLLNHSDCDGEISCKHAKMIADELEDILPSLQGMDGGGHIGDYVEKTKWFIAGCRLAYSKKQNLLFQ